jgi:hypothetical protein
MVLLVGIDDLLSNFLGAGVQISDDETVQEDTLDMDTSQHLDDIENCNPVRCSTRERTQPAWLRSDTN